MVIGFDFDGTLTDESFAMFLKGIAPSLNRNNKLILITSRGEIEQDIIEKTVELGLQFDELIPMGKTIHLTKADFVKATGIELHLFFDNDPYEVEGFLKIGIPCLFIPPEPDTLMEEICEGFIKEKAEEL